SFDMWMTRVRASLDGIHLRGYVMKLNYGGISDKEDGDSGIGMPNEDDNTKDKRGRPLSSTDAL
ncbi:hypothetical protein L915_14158, partial [Phytophthora nicotianae]